MKIRIANPDGQFHSMITDAETGAVIKGVREVRFTHRAGDPPLVELDFIGPDQFDVMGYLSSVARELILLVAADLDSMPRTGSEVDQPEGARTVEVSDTRLRHIAEDLRLAVSLGKKDGAA